MKDKINVNGSKITLYIGKSRSSSYSIFYIENLENKIIEGIPESIKIVKKIANYLKKYSKENPLMHGLDVTLTFSDLGIVKGDLK